MKVYTLDEFTKLARSGGLAKPIADEPYTARTKAEKPQEAPGAQKAANESKSAREMGPESAGKEAPTPAKEEVSPEPAPEHTAAVDEGSQTASLGFFAAFLFCSAAYFTAASGDIAFAVSAHGGFSGTFVLYLSRDSEKVATGKCGGRRSYFEVRPDVVALARQLQAGGMSLRKISAELAPTHPR